MGKKALKNTGITIWLIRIGLVMLVLSFFLPLFSTSVNMFGEVKSSSISMFDMLDEIKKILNSAGVKLSLQSLVRFYSFWSIPLCAFLSLLITLKPTRASLILTVLLLFLPLVIIVVSLGTVGDWSKFMRSDNPMAAMGKKMIIETFKQLNLSPSLGAYSYSGGFLITLLFSAIGERKLKKSAD